MKTLESILGEIDKIVNQYESGAYNSPEKLRELQRSLSINMYHLTKEKIDYKKLWNATVFGRGTQENGKKESVASAESRADNLYPQLDKTKEILDALKNVSISMTNELKIMQNEG